MLRTEVLKETKISDTMVLLRLFDYQGALTVRYHRLRSFYRRRLFAAYITGTANYCKIKIFAVPLITVPRKL